MTDWEFWGNRTILQAIGAGFLLAVAGMALGLALNPALILIAVVGVVIMLAAGGYLYVWENWDLLRKSKGTYGEMTREEEAVLKEELGNLRR